MTKCNTRRKKRATSGGDVVLEFKLELDDQAQLDLQNMYDNNIGELNHMRNINFFSHYQQDVSIFNYRCVWLNFSFLFNFEQKII